MSENLNRFLVDLATDQNRLVRFADNPADELSGAGLTSDETTAVMSGDSRTVTAAAGGSRSGIIDDFLTPAPVAPRRAPGKRRPAKPARKKRPAKPPRRKPPSKPARRKRPTPARRKRPAPARRKRPAPARRRKGPSRPSRKKR